MEGSNLAILGRREGRLPGKTACHEKTQRKAPGVITSYSIHYTKLYDFFFAHTRDRIAGPRCVDCNACVGHLGARPADCYHPYVRSEKDAMLSRLEPH